MVIRKLIISPVGQYSWKLQQDFKVKTSIGVITVPKGKVTDLASVPKLLWGIFPPYGRYTESAVVHDYLYAIGHNRKEADKIFLELMLNNGTSKLRAYPMYLAVRCFGWLAYKKKSK